MSNLKKIINIVEEKQKEKCEKVFYVRELPNPDMVNERTILGTMSMAQKAGRVVFIKKDTAVKLRPDLIESPPRLARIYLKSKFVKSPRIKISLVEKLSIGLRPRPLFSKPMSFEYGFYIDIKSAYWSIINSVGWDVDYNPSNWLSRGTVLDDFPFQDDKRTRSCLVSVTAFDPRSKKTILSVADPRWREYGWKYKTGQQAIINTLANPALQRIVSDVLNSIAFLAVQAGAIYVNNDGYIAPNEKVAGNIVHIIHNWGLSCGIKAEGAGRVVSNGVWQIGQQQTRNYERMSENNFTNIYRPRYINWLEQSFSFWASGAKNTP